LYRVIPKYLSKVTNAGEVTQYTKSIFG